MIYCKRTAAEILRLLKDKASQLRICANSQTDPDDMFAHACRWNGLLDAVAEVELFIAGFPEEIGPP